MISLRIHSVISYPEPCNHEPTCSSAIQKRVPAKLARVVHDSLARQRALITLSNIHSTFLRCFSLFSHHLQCLEAIGIRSSNNSSSLSSNRRRGCLDSRLLSRLRLGDLDSLRRGDLGSRRREEGCLEVVGDSVSERCVDAGGGGSDGREEGLCKLMLDA